jgi:Ser/Thr protein kinase RdoA (MazF antagonist)
MTDSTHPYAVLDPDTVLDAVEQLGFRPDARFFALNSYENRVYQIGLEDGPPIIAKFYRPGRWTREQILEEHAFSQELAALEIPVVAPLISPTYGSLAEYKNFQIAVFPQLIGRAPDLGNLDNLLVMGRFIGRIHAVGMLAKFHNRPIYSSQLFGHGPCQYLLEHDFIPAELLSAYESLTRDLLQRIDDLIAGVGKLHMFRIHGDCHLGNVLWRDDTPNFVDFDDTLTGPAMQDLWMLLSGERDQRQGQLLDLAEGYNEFCDFNTKELPLIEAFRTLRIMHYSAWLARRWQDPAFPMNFPWFNTIRYWSEHILELREQMSALDEPPLTLF